MGLFGTKERPRGGRVLKASGMRIQANSAETVRALANTRRDWQRDAWGYRKMIGELRFALQFRARAVSKARYYVAQIVDGEDEPIDLDSEEGVTIPAALIKAAKQELARLPWESGYRFTGVMDENFGVAGEVYLHGFYREDGTEVWEPLSVSEVEPGSDGRMSIRRYGTATSVLVNEDEEELLRLWSPDPEYGILADSPMQSLLGVCEQLVLNGREMRAASRSRFAANGLLLVPSGLAMLNALKSDTTLVEDNDFMADLAATLLAPINNEGDPGAVIPAVLMGEGEDLDKVRHLRMERETSADLIGKIDKDLARLARGLDIPPEIITGMAQANHWTAWQIDASTFRHHIAPAIQILVDSLTEAFLRPALLARGFAPEAVALLRVWYDAGSITENPNRGQDAKDAYDRGAIGMSPLRQALGFSEADAPDDEELLKMIATRIGIDPATSGVLLQTLFGRPQVITATNPTGDAARQAPAIEQAPTGPGDAAPGTADAATPAQQSSLLTALMAAATPPEPELTVVDGRLLLDLDRAERDRLLMAADATVTRALEKAGAKVRSKAQKDKALAAKLADMAVTDIAAFVGRDGVAAFALSGEELLGDGLDALGEKYRRWTLAAIERTIAAVLAMLRLTEDSDRGAKVAKRLRDGLSSRVESGWSLFRTKLFGLAEQYLYEPHPDQEPGEAPDVIVPPGLVRGVLAHVGGLPPDTGGIDDDGTPVNPGRPLGGIALGEEVTETLRSEGAEELGFEWVYGLTPVRHFEPHRELDGVRLASWKDQRLVPSPKYAWVGPYFTPGDHNGCMCDYMPSYAIPEYGDIVDERLSTESVNARNDRILAESDDAAGRTGTTAQHARDERQRVLKLRDRWLKDGK